MDRVITCQLMTCLSLQVKLSLSTTSATMLVCNWRVRTMLWWNQNRVVGRNHLSKVKMFCNRSSENATARKRTTLYQLLSSSGNYWQLGKKRLESSSSPDKNSSRLFATTNTSCQQNRSNTRLSERSSATLRRTLWSLEVKLRKVSCRRRRPQRSMPRKCKLISNNLASWSKRSRRQGLRIPWL